LFHAEPAVANDGGVVATAGFVADVADAVGQHAAALDDQRIEERVAADHVGAIADPVAGDPADDIGLGVGGELRARGKGRCDTECDYGEDSGLHVGSPSMAERIGVWCAGLSEMLRANDES